MSHPTAGIDDSSVRAVRLARWGVLSLLIAILMPAWFFGGLPFVSSWPALLVAFGVLLVTGIVMIARALHLAGKPWGLALLIVAVPIPLAGMVMIPPAIALLALGVVVGACAFLTRVDTVEHGQRTAAPRRHRAFAGAGVAVLLLAVSAVGLADTLVLQPLAMTDDAYDLDDVYGMIGPAAATGGAVMPTLWAAFGVLLAAGFAVVPPLANGPVAAWLGIRRIVALGVGAAGAGLMALPWAGFALGMEISDTVPPMRGGVSPLTAVLTALGFVLVVAVIVGTVPPSPLRRPRAVVAG
ncbi:hypothetical protein CLV46_1057 [Diaminobutyricimonas aerilata]|uniref:Uncharacterized protein n=1 Tax=Diaminobutyricimonas aerilata TaxID=1162967 RepID=A0A2M9CHZ6_9MICO|nr:hypothetical protein [Diaminobutyricimonas aerilata]PJJ71508.1 hypothetical protein CLV46_1057 [Diaminobutyricimonas aerilata]